MQAKLACLLAVSILLGVTAVWQSLSYAAEEPPLSMTASVTESPLYTPPAAKADVTDTLYLLGGPERGDGKFQKDNLPHIPDDEGWVPLGQFEGSGDYWHIHTFNAELLDPVMPDNHAMWCGIYYPPCEGEPENPGYGNQIRAHLEWTQPVSDPELATQVRLMARLNHDTELSYDFLYLDILQGAEWTILATWTGDNRSGGEFAPVEVDETIILQPSDYTGENQDEVRLRWRFESDGGYSDADCLFLSDGAAQVDNITVIFDQGAGPVTVTFDDFEAGSPVNWVYTRPLCSLAKIWPQLPDLGLCGTNVTPQLAFIDDGSACFSEGSWGTDWTYGPNGLTVYCPQDISIRYDDQAWSPPIDLPPDLVDYDGARLAFDIYQHGNSLSSLAYSWHVRTSNDGGFTWASWQDLVFVYEQGYPAYKRDFFDITTLIDTGANKIQISLGVFKFQNFTDCSFVTPAPYFDNVALSLFRRAGPEVYLFRNNRRGLARSGFPASGTLDLEDPASHSVCFDSALGDSVVVRVGVLRDGAQLAGPPELHWQLKKNPIYDPYRQLPPSNPVLGDSVRPPHLGDGQRGILYAFDLPDAGFLFPGDVLHYYIRAVDDAAGDLGVATLPADTTGYSIFPSDAAYLADLFPLDFEVRALPSVHDLTTGDQPRILVWLHTVSQEEIDEWVVALANLGYRHGVDIDFFRSPYPAPLQATAGQMIGYEVLLYSSGKNVTRSLSFQELLNLQDWFALGGKKALFAGDNFVSGVRQESITFPREYLGLDIETGAAGSNVRPQIDDQVRPLVLPMAGNPLDLTIEFLADGGCYYNLFDAITPYGTGERVLEFTAPGGGPGGYTPAAGIYQYRVVDDAHTLTLPYGFAFIGTPLGQKDGALAARTRFLAEVMTFFGAPATGPPTDLPAQEGFTVRFYPNPFNPRVQVEYDMPRRGRLSLHIYNLRGELVRTLIDEVVPPGPGRLIWDATDTEGRTAAAGVYFLAIKAPGLREVRKMALIK